MYEFPRLEITPGQERVHAQIIGNTGLGKRIQSLLKNQEVAVILIPDFPDGPYPPDSPLPDYVYWFSPRHKIPPVLTNYLKSSQAKLIIVRRPGLPDFPDSPDFLSSILDLGVDACQVFVKDIYGPSVGDSDLSSIWQDLKSKFQVNLPDNDSAEIYPIYIDDAAAAIIKISFSTQTYGRTFYITGSDKTTVLSFSYRLREEVIRQTQKLPSINYTPSQLHSVFSIQYSVFNQQAASTRDFLSWRPETDLSEGLKKLVSGVCKAGGGRGDPARAPAAISEDVGAGWSPTGPAVRSRRTLKKKNDPTLPPRLRYPGRPGDRFLRRHSLPSPSLGLSRRLPRQNFPGPSGPV